MIEVKNLNKTFGKQVVLNKLNITIPSGLIFALLGPNGSGKSTFIKCLLGLALPDNKNSIFLNGQNISEDVHYKERISYMPQSPSFPANLKVKEIIKLNENLNAKEPIFKDILIKDLSIDSFYDKPFSKLSRGMKQKVNILQCFMYDRDIYIIDEATASLSPDISFYLKNLLKTKEKENKLLLFTSHVMSEVEELAKKVAVLLEGKLVLLGNPADIISSTKGKNLEESIRLLWKTKQNENV
ncbi:MAG: ABC transporter ATP-binding protein [Leptospiraceae bacterium]|nr:ABC transporter ATP-binding protein [Leptospiraceae bacterium]